MYSPTPQVEKLALAEGSKVVLATMQSAVNQVGSGQWALYIQGWRGALACSFSASAFVSP